MNNMARRVGALEASSPDRWQPWHQVIQDIGETEQEAVTRHQAEHGPLGEDCNIVFCKIVAPDHGNTLARGEAA